MSYSLAPGDIIYLDLSPTVGHEQRGKRPCIVLSERILYSSMICVAPITTKRKVFPFHVDLPDSLKIEGQILMEHHRMVDVKSRGYQLVEKAPVSVLDACRELMRVLYNL
ncbi:type II toxin-antitoxin system PemK/MazF family toxin [Listeria seeligeri]|uniref:Type II toxin-antitoxin system PemK/MazF family toxin n=1 Tax=Listeria seeligeri TaxID=1640 RepID=A0A7T0MAV4_LISSE|nr:type II toxin-antitoxin system PemK/MazF family toxin [Listeria seeligeri]MBC1917034.1 type II toxin-antitoxin system PemK/MazF family toxin [Listeria seeligeri]MBC1990410.1 type II toxin-antitoxin system PemK/MazF family toxin [Listeria seeligeri]MBF2356056.1 type II toxin-antitoxin system PemK/MazF family toxin [Listeria seeligeri]MBF2375223.1 type II toxin-antitoxin system PemK/MazF family toxin [Listeria seeligeri]QPL19430.1 type II toxin-antitoxin system PemK/MazF family toxin [Listeri